MTQSDVDICFTESRIVLQNVANEANSQVWNHEEFFTRHIGKIVMFLTYD